MFVQTIIGCQLSHLYWKSRVDSTQKMIQITITIIKLSEFSYLGKTKFHMRSNFY